jgi:hypothetical protein
MRRDIFNPLSQESGKTETGYGDGISQSSDKKQTATAAIYNEVVGTCPKCGQAMATAQIANGDTVFFCHKDRVSTPMADTSA